jgi:hypothetical protein
MLELHRPDLKKIVIAIGTTGTGKSTIINMLFNNAWAKKELEGPCNIGSTTDSVTKGSKWSFSAKDLTLYGDTVGLSDPDQTNFNIAMGVKRFINVAKGGVNSIIIVLKYGRISKEERTNLEIISNIFDRNWCNSCIIVATHYEGELNGDGVLDQDIEKREIEKWIGNDKEIKDFVKKIGGRVILTDTSLGRHEEDNRPLRKQTLEKLKSFIDTCEHVVGPCPVSWIEVVSAILETYFGFYRLSRTKERIAEIIQYLSDERNEDISAGECPICHDEAIFSEMGQTGCNHVFHLKCIEEAVAERGGPCPICRTPVTSLYSPLFFDRSKST